MARTSAKIIGGAKVKASFTKLGNKARADTRNQVVVGYSAAHAQAVHDNTKMKLAGQPRPSGIGVYWGRPSQPGKSKFLADPARTGRISIGRRIAAVTKSTKSLSRGLYSGGLLLRDLSLEQVPVEYGDLRGSVFVTTMTL